MITIEQPAMVLNAVTPPPQIARYQMWNSWDVQPAANSGRIIENCRTVARSAPGGKLKNLIIQCHGAPGQISIGQGFDRSNVGLFSGLQGCVELIWIVACQPARISVTCSPGTFCPADGNLFISEMARAAQCEIIAPTETQTNRSITYAFGMIPSYEGLIVKYNRLGRIYWSQRYPSTHQGE